MIRATIAKSSRCNVRSLSHAAGRLFLVAAFAFMLAARPAIAQNRAITQVYGTPAGKSPVGGLANEIGIDQHLNQQLPLDLPFRDEQGKQVRLGDYFGDKPVVLTLVYFRCPMLCTQVLNGLLRGCQAVKFEMGRDYEIVTVSIDPNETPRNGRGEKGKLCPRYRREGGRAGLALFDRQAEAIHRLADAVGFRYRYDERTDQFAHASGIMLATPDGRLSRYLYGIEYPPNDLRLGLVESSEHRIGSPVDQVLLLLLPLRPADGQIRSGDFAAALELAGSITMLALGGFLDVMFRQEVAASDAVRPAEQARRTTTNQLRRIEMMEDGFSLFPAQASTHAPRVDLLYSFLVALFFLVQIVIAFLIIYFAVRYRRGSKADRSPAKGVDAKTLHFRQQLMEASG